LITDLTTIQNEDVDNAPGQKEAIEEFFNRTQGYPLIAHNGFAFDRVVLLNIATRLKVETPKNLVFLDTLLLARIFHQAPGQRHTNEDLAKFYHCHQEGAHRADVDVVMLCGVVLGLLAETNNHPAGGLIYKLLFQSGEPWADLLDEPIKPLDLDNVLAQLGKAQLPLLAPRNKASGVGAERTAVDTIFAEMVARGRDGREPQKRFAHLAADAFRTRQFAVVEAGTGTGKSLGYLIPAALQAHSQGQPVVVSTYTKVLQSQLVEKDIAFLQELIPNLTAVTLKGRSNYLSINRLWEELLDGVEEDYLSRARAWTLGLLTSLALASPTGDLEATWFTLESLDEYLDSQGEPFIIQSNVRANAASRAAKASLGNRLDFYDAAKENAARADIVVVNHSLLLAQAVTTEDDRLPELISPFVICDESHNLEDAATSVLKQEVSEKGLRRLIHAIYDDKARTGLLTNLRKIGFSTENEIFKKTTQALFESNLHIDNISTRLQTFVEANTIVSSIDRARFGASLELRSSSLHASGGPALRESAIALLEALDKLSNALTELVQAVVEQNYNNKNTNRTGERVTRLAYSLAMDLFEAKKILSWFWRFYEATTYVRVIKIEPDRQSKLFWTLEGLPIDVSVLFFCSATLATHGDEFGFFLRRNGLDRLQKTKVVTEVLPHVFDYKSNALLMLPAHLPTPRDEALKKEFPQAVAAELLRFIPYFRGRTLGLFTARSRMRMVYEQIGSTLGEKGYPILCQGEGALAKLREEFERCEEVSLFGVRSLWEGVDVPGRSLSFVFMSKMPFPSLGEPLESARMSAVER
ncbi:MAG: ATP-dependent DNA helicase DinG, partial [bacterium]